jgi:circadian clock protein KaiC
MPEERHLVLHMHELLSYLNQKGVVTILVTAQSGLIGSNIKSPMDISYLADSMILLRHFEAFGIVRQAVSMLKKRSGNHERSIRELFLGDAGLQVGPPLSNFRGVLSGVPEFTERQNGLESNGNTGLGSGLESER